MCKMYQQRDNIPCTVKNSRSVEGYFDKDYDKRKQPLFCLFTNTRKLDINYCLKK